MNVKNNELKLLSKCQKKMPGTSRGDREGPVVGGDWDSVDVKQELKSL